MTFHVDRKSLGKIVDITSSFKIKKIPTIWCEHFLQIFLKNKNLLTIIYIFSCKFSFHRKYSAKLNLQTHLQENSQIIHRGKNLYEKSAKIMAFLIVCNVDGLIVNPQQRIKIHKIFIFYLISLISVRLQLPCPQNLCASFLV